MDIRHISIRQAGDARDEQMNRVSSTLARFGPTPQVPSPNLAKVFAAIETGEIAPLVRLAERIENGDAKETEEEHTLLYEGLPLLVNYVLDLADMCRRREQALAECDVEVGFKKLG